MALQSYVNLDRNARSYWSSNLVTCWKSRMFVGHCLAFTSFVYE